MRTRWMVGAVVAAGLLMAVYARSQETRLETSGATSAKPGKATYDYPPPATGQVPPTGITPITPPVNPPKVAHKPASVADLFAGLEEIQRQRAQLKEKEQQLLARIESALQEQQKTIEEQQKTLDAHRVKLRGVQWGSIDPLGCTTSSGSSSRDAAPPLKAPAPKKQTELIFNSGLSR